MSFHHRYFIMKLYDNERLFLKQEYFQNHAVPTRNTQSKKNKCCA